MDGGNAALSTEQSGLSLTHTCLFIFSLSLNVENWRGSLNLYLGFNRQSCTYIDVRSLKMKITGWVMMRSQAAH